MKQTAGWEVVYRGFDPIEVEMAESQLRAAGVPCVRTGRGNAALLGAGNFIVEQAVRVPKERFDEASALLSTRSIRVVGELEQAALAAGPEDAPPMPAGVDPRSVAVATRAVGLLLLACVLYVAAIVLWPLFG